jgi:hypothetical protein
MFQVGNYLINPQNILWCELELVPQNDNTKKLTAMVIHFCNGARVNLNEEEAGQFWHRLKQALAPPQMVEVPPNLLRMTH